MSAYTALLEANVLYPARMMDLLMQLTVADLFPAKWTANIHREWIEALPLAQPQRDRVTLERTRDRMNASTWDCLMSGYQTLIPSLQLLDPDDRHVIAAAIVGNCDAIVTKTCVTFRRRLSLRTPWRLCIWMFFCSRRLGLSRPSFALPCVKFGHV